MNDLLACTNKQTQEEKPLKKKPTPLTQPVNIQYDGSNTQHFR